MSRESGGTKHAFALQKEPAGSIMARCLERGERRWVGIVTMSAKKLGLEASLRPVGIGQ
jgi:hypothetical protein